MSVLMSKKDAKRVVPPCNTTSLNVAQNIYTIFFLLLWIWDFFKVTIDIFSFRWSFGIVLWEIATMGDYLYSVIFLLFSLDILFLNSDPPAPLKKNNFININKTKTKTKTEAKKSR